MDEKGQLDVHPFETLSKWAFVVHLTETLTRPYIKPISTHSNLLSFASLFKTFQKRKKLRPFCDDANRTSTWEY